MDDPFVTMEDVQSFQYFMENMQRRVHGNVVHVVLRGDDIIQILAFKVRHDEIRVVVEIQFNVHIVIGKCFLCEIEFVDIGSAPFICPLVRSQMHDLGAFGGITSDFMERPEAALVHLPSERMFLEKGAAVRMLRLCVFVGRP